MQRTHYLWRTQVKSSGKILNSCMGFQANCLAIVVTGQSWEVHVLGGLSVLVFLIN